MSTRWGVMIKIRWLLMRWEGNSRESDALETGAAKMEGTGVVVIEMPSIVLPENMYNLSYNSIGARVYFAFTYDDLFQQHGCISSIELRNS